LTRRESGAEAFQVVLLEIAAKLYIISHIAIKKPAYFRGKIDIGTKIRKTRHKKGAGLEARHHQHSTSHLFIVKEGLGIIN
jgi:hypothetical protein